MTIKKSSLYGEGNVHFSIGIRSYEGHERVDFLMKKKTEYILKTIQSTINDFNLK